MKSNYNTLGKYVRLIDIRNTDLQIENLLGVNVSKNFMPSVANTIGTDMTNYKIVKKNQFACNPMHVGRDRIFPVAMLKDYDVALVSPAYFVFEIIDTNELLPDYLMMWFRRPETDHFMWFKTDSSVRGGIGWNEICSVELPVPDIPTQQKIVDEYNVLSNRIAQNEQMNLKLDETAQAIYKQWFVDFEFPDENGQPYKSSGGEFEESELGDIPKGWTVGQLNDELIFSNGQSKPSNSGEYPVYGGNGILDYVSTYNNEDIIAIGRVGAYCGSLYYEPYKCWISDNAISAHMDSGCNNYGFQLLKGLNLNERQEGTSQPLLTQGMLNSIKCSIPPRDLIKTYERIAKPLALSQYSLSKEKKALNNLCVTFLEKMSMIGD